jgi:hypothetical protein
MRGGGIVDKGFFSSIISYNHFAVHPSTGLRVTFVMLSLSKHEPQSPFPRAPPSFQCAPTLFTCAPPIFRRAPPLLQYLRRAFQLLH